MRNLEAHRRFDVAEHGDGYAEAGAAGDSAF